MLWGQSVLISGSSLRPCTLAPTSSSEWMAVRHRDFIFAHFKELGLRLNISKVCFSSTENLLSGRGVGSDHNAGTYVPSLDRVNPHFTIYYSVSQLVGQKCWVCSPKMGCETVLSGSRIIYSQRNENKKRNSKCFSDARLLF